VNVDEENKIIRDYDVSPANTHDSQKFEEIVTVGDDTGKPFVVTETVESEDIPEDTPKVYADKAYDSDKICKFLGRAGLEPQICRKAKRGAPLSASQKEENRNGRRYAHEWSMYLERCIRKRMISQYERLVCRARRQRSV
jgi:aminoglycoside phosphotransferase (APT) family kinase protein